MPSPLPLSCHFFLFTIFYGSTTETSTSFPGTPILRFLTSAFDLFRSFDEEETSEVILGRDLCETFSKDSEYSLKSARGLHIPSFKQNSVSKIPLKSLLVIL